MSPLKAKADLVRVVFTPGEFATLFGKSQTWGYREIYAGRVKTITQHGRIMIPANEVERILESADIYNGRPPTPSVKARLKKLDSVKADLWRQFVEAKCRRNGQPVPVVRARPAVVPKTGKKTALDRLVKRAQERK